MGTQITVAGVDEVVKTIKKIWNAEKKEMAVRLMAGTYKQASEQLGYTPFLKGNNDASATPQDPKGADADVLGDVSFITYNTPYAVRLWYGLDSWHWTKTAHSKAGPKWLERLIREHPELQERLIKAIGDAIAK